MTEDEHPNERLVTPSEDGEGFDRSLVSRRSMLGGSALLAGLIAYTSDPTDPQLPGRASGSAAGIARASDNPDEPLIILGPESDPIGYLFQDTAGGIILQDATSGNHFWYNEAQGRWETDAELDVPTLTATTTTTEDASIADIDNLTERISNETDRIIGAVDWALLDDWGDNSLTGRTNPVTDHHVNVVDGLLTAIYRPEWTTASGSPSASAGALQLSAGDSITQAVEVAFGLRVGEWEFDYQWGSNPTSSLFQVQLFREDVDNRWHVEIENGGTINLTKRDAGTETNVVSSAQSDDTNEHRIRVTRDWNGNWEIFQDGTSLGTATDTFLPSLNVFRIANFADAAIDVPHVRAYR